jgi:hypothetical protein
MNGGVTKLTEAAKRIGDVIDAISTIAAQTNLLALNAAIVPGGADDKGDRRGQPTNIVDSVGDRGVGVSDQGNHGNDQSGLGDLVDSCRGRRRAGSCNPANCRQCSTGLGGNEHSCLQHK